MQSTPENLTHENERVCACETPSLLPFSDVWKGRQEAEEGTSINDQNQPYATREKKRM